MQEQGGLFDLEPQKDVNKAESESLVDVQIGVYDLEEIHPDCTVQIWKNRTTGEVSIGWWENKKGVEG